MYNATQWKPRSGYKKWCKNIVVEFLRDLYKCSFFSKCRVYKNLCDFKKWKSRATYLKYFGKKCNKNASSWELGIKILLAPSYVRVQLNIKFHESPSISFCASKAIKMFVVFFFFFLGYYILKSVLVKMQELFS